MRIHVPDIRIRALNDGPVADDGRYVLYWMLTSRRPHHNFGLDRAVERARHLGRPLLVVCTLKCDYPWASDRLQRFMLQDMADNVAAFAHHGVHFYPFVERKKGEQAGFIEALAEDACLVISDDFPCFFLPQLLQDMGKSLPVRLEVVDSIGLLPLRASDRAFPTAYAFRRYLQRALPAHLEAAPQANPFAYQGDHLKGAKLRPGIRQRWPAATADLLAAGPAALAALPVDHSVGPAAFDGGHRAAEKALATFLTQRLGRYADERNHPDAKAASDLSPYLHFGHLSVHQIFAELVEKENWQLGQLSQQAKGSREGWWNMSPHAEAFLDELVTWRELGQNMCVHRPEDYAKYASLPEWARKTLDEHRDDPRPEIYTRAQLAASETSCPVWNAAQTQLRREGRLHNYLRMLWGKKVLAWSRTPEEALAHLEELNNKYAVDGRDANSYAGIFWVFGRYDRPWPSHPIYGKVRYMTAKSTLNKLKMRDYMAAYGEA